MAAFGRTSEKGEAMSEDYEKLQEQKSKIERRTAAAECEHLRQELQLVRGERDQLQAYIDSIEANEIIATVGELQAENVRLRNIILADGLDPDTPIPPGLALEKKRLEQERDGAQSLLALRDEEIERNHAAVAKYLSATNHDLCHENRKELAEAFGIADGFKCDLTFEEFADGCRQYQSKLFGKVAHDAYTTAAVIERVAAAESTDSASDDLTVPLAFELVKLEQGIREALPSTYYADRTLIERITLLVDHWRRLVEVNKQLDERNLEVEGKYCPRCGASLFLGKALMNQAQAGLPDFPGDSGIQPGQTFSFSGEAKMVECLKCEKCGYSRTLQ
jgi:ribosomal protein S27AE